MDAQIEVYIDLNEVPHRVGRLWPHVRSGRESATFEYTNHWLENPERFSLDPMLPLASGPFHTEQDTALFGSIADSAPDRWGRALIRRAERRRARGKDETPRTLFEIDYVLGVDDQARQGALRFSRSIGGSFLAHQGEERIPPVFALPKLLSAAEHVIADTETEEDLALLLAPGSSLGGARPKASIVDLDKILAVAKFPHPNDEWDTVLWEAVALSLAGSAGVTTPSWRLIEVEGKSILISHRFDRQGKTRIPFLSAMSMLGAKDNETRSYLEIVDSIRQQGASPKANVHQLWRRIVFTILISNVDDHLRNHGFLHLNQEGWDLSPAYDLNPMPTDVRPRILSTTIDEGDAEAALDSAFGVAEYFDLTLKEARKIASEVGKSVSDWRKTAVELGCSRMECDRMASAFEHDDLKLALEG
ncbi:MAG: type II toxin-antitoxin system HipA family toxin [Candidatus Omnitrophica bacterium]|nr:type II toxin-antitoxin system HipA family toxin [Candidatus Omnitrophota bacterium]